MKLIGIGCFALAITGIFAADVARVPEKRAKVIVRFADGNLDASVARVSRAGGRLYRKLPLIQSAAFGVAARDVDRLRLLPGVLDVAEEASVSQTMYDVTPAVGATTAYSSGFTGKGVGVAIIDSGISVNSDLLDSTGKSRLKVQEVFTAETVQQDVYGHGTHIAGIVGGTGANASGTGYTKSFRGIAPGVNFVSMIALDRYGHGRESDVIAAIARVVALKSTYNIRVLNLSLGKPVTKKYSADPLCLAVEAAWKAGIVVVVSAGNEGRNNSMKTEGYGTISSPGNDPYVITVGAMRPMGTTTRADDVMASYSSKGPTLLDHIVKPDLVAPGNKVISILS